MEKRTVEKNGYTFVLGASKKFDRDFERVFSIIDKGPENITAADRIELIMLYHAAFHTGGKIAGVTSYDSSATNCEFCKKCRAAAEKVDSHICAKCYDYAQEHGFKGPNMLNRHTLNMVIMSSVEFTREELARIPASKINRVNSSGDTPNTTYAINMLNLAHVNRYFNFAYWVKNTAAVIAAVEKVGKPKNMILVQSSCIIGRPAKLAKYFDYVFTVYESEEAVKNAIVSGAMSCNGTKCQECGYKCYNGTWPNGSNIAELLKGRK